MDLFMKALQRLRFASIMLDERNRSNGAGRSSSRLGSLPNELLDHITQYLGVSDITSLSLCDHDLYATLGSASLKSLLVDPQEKSRFLLRLVQDISWLFYCYDCRKLHPTGLLKPPGLPLTARTLQCVKQEVPPHCFQTHFSAPHYLLTFQHVQVAMMHHRLRGMPGLSVESLAFSEVQSCQEFYATTLLSVEPKVVACALLLRIQQWTVFRAGNGDHVYGARNMSICSHISRVSPNSYLSNLYRCRLEHPSEHPGCSSCHDFLQCNACRIVFRIDKASVQGSLALVVTKWLRLGKCETPDDIEWRRHRYDPKVQTCLMKVDPLNGVHSEFARVETTSQSRLTLRNRQLLGQHLLIPVEHRSGKIMTISLP